MKKPKILSVVLILIIAIVLSSCIKSNSKPATSSNEQLINGFVNKHIRISLEPEYNLESVNWIDENKLLLISEKNMSGNDIHEYKKIYVFNISDNSKELIYNGEFFGDAYNTQIIKLENGNLGIRSFETFLIFDPSTFKLIKEFKNINSDYQIFPDGNRICYMTPEGIYISEISNPKSFTIIDSYEYIIGPKLLNNKVLYCKIFSNEAQLHTYNPSNKKKDQIKVLKDTVTLDPETGNIFIFSNENRILVQIRIAEDQYKFINRIINLNNSTVTTVEGDNLSIEDVSGNQILFRDINQDPQLNVLDVKTNQKLTITPSYRLIESAKFSPTQKSIVYIGIPTDTNERMLFIASVTG